MITNQLNFGVQIPTNKSWVSEINRMSMMDAAERDLHKVVKTLKKEIIISKKDQNND